MSLYIYSIDFAKYSLSIPGEDANGNTLIHKTISRAKVLSFFAYLPPAIVAHPCEQQSCLPE
ncbi:hypothetical protein [Photobacterium aquae]|uniref:hypothetical protein n=1 Tax=Photobacterium aquae TaxID=1195763 RepID=UPI000A800AC0|nr:hypothetical protein [Photobacterium aquae]